MKETDGGDFVCMLLHCEFFVQLNLPRRLHKTLTGWMVSDSALTWRSWLHRFYTLHLLPNHVISFLSALSCNRREAHHCDTSAVAQHEHFSVSRGGNCRFPLIDWLHRWRRTGSTSAECCFSSHVGIKPIWQDLDGTVCGKLSISAFVVVSNTYRGSTHLLVNIGNVADAIDILIYWTIGLK